MSAYAAGFGAGRGWLTCHCVPDELRELLAGAPSHTIIPNGPTPVGARSIATADLITDYGTALAAAPGAGVRFMCRLTVDPGGIVWMRGRPRRGEEPFEFASFALPPVNVDGLTLLAADDGHIATGVTHPEESVLGLRLTFPRVMFLASEGFEVAHDTDGLPDAHLYRELAAMIRSRTSPLTLVTPAGNRRTRVRATRAGTEYLADHPYMVRNRLVPQRPKRTGPVDRRP